jgi:hypothetical protein
MDFLDAIAGGNGQAEWSSRGFASTPADGDKEDLLGSGIELDEVAELLGISFDVSKQWVVDDEPKLFEVGFIVPRNRSTPCGVARHDARLLAFNASSVPWLFVTV